MSLISNVSLLNIKSISQNIEIFEEMLIVNGCDSSYRCFYSFLIDFHTLKAELNKEIMHTIQNEAF